MQKLYEEDVTDREACIILNMVSGIGSTRLEALSSAFGSPAKVLQAAKRDLTSVAGIGPSLAEKVASWESNVEFEKEMQLVDKAGVKLITKVDDEYPDILKEIHDPPLCLYVRGQLPDLNSYSLAIVGSRRISIYGRSMAKHLAESASFAGWTVVSGLAFGVDAIAHKATLDAGGKTVAVLGGGLSRIYPQENIPLARDIINNGALISEFPMGFTPNRRSFPMRNRIISGLCRGTLIIEAGTNSGSLITADFALEQGRLVFAVPGQADNPQARGCNKLIKTGAKLTESFEDIVEEFEFLPGMRVNKTETRHEDVSREKSAPKASLSDDETIIAEVLSREPTSVDVISSATGIPIGKLLSILMRLEMKKIITQHPGQKYSTR